MPLLKWQAKANHNKTKKVIEENVGFGQLQKIIKHFKWIKLIYGP